MSLTPIRSIRFLRPRQGISEAWLRLCIVDDIEYLRTAMTTWKEWAEAERAAKPLFNWVSIRNFQTDQNSRILCLDSTDQPVGHSHAGTMSFGAMGTEALMFVKLGHTVRCDAGHRAPLVYVGFLEVAPWNHPGAAVRQYNSLGPLMIRAACSLSLEQGRDGRVALHAVAAGELLPTLGLPQH